MMIAGILTLVIPAGQYTRIEVDGRETIDPDSFQFVEKPAYPIWRWFLAPFEVLGSSTGYQNIVQVDIHTGYGPRDQMTVIVPPVDKASSAELILKFKYPLVQKIDAEEFFAISGDMGEYVYRLRDVEYPGKSVFTCGFEFGTFGDSLTALIRSLRITVLENQLRHYGAVSSKAEQQVRAEYEELFFPSEQRWRDKAIADCRQAFEGILIAYSIL